MKSKHFAVNKRKNKLLHSLGGIQEGEPRNLHRQRLSDYHSKILDTSVGRVGSLIVREQFSGTPILNGIQFVCRQIQVFSKVASVVRNSIFETML
jgi:uncharacterized heparinase superfamily protein